MILNPLDDYRWMVFEGFFNKYLKHDDTDYSLVKI